MIMDPLSELFRKYGSDKGGEHLIAGDTCHNYGVAYYELFKHRREQVKNVFEIGINYGCSLRAWRDYFPNAQVVGIDSNEGCLFWEDRISCFAADQFNADDLSDVLKKLDHPQFDLIIDDGSHERAHQIFSAQYLLPSLVLGGLYVIEDIYPDCQPELVGNPVVTVQSDYAWYAIPTGRGLGKAHCGCGCGQGEQLVVFTRGAGWPKFG